MRRNYIRRYMQAEHALQLLKTNKFALLDPDSWSDRNDSASVEAYRQSKGGLALYIACFTESGERHHHWDSFGGSGSAARNLVCVEFEKFSLIRSIRSIGHRPRAQAVRYIKIEDLRESPPKIKELPFIKRWPYGDENEFRILLEEPGPQKSLKLVSIDDRAIVSVSLGPYIKKKVREKIRSNISKIFAGEKKISSTTIIDNRQWRKIVTAIGQKRSK